MKGFSPASSHALIALNKKGPLLICCCSLSLERLQLLMGDALFLEAISGENPYGYAALRSLPLRDDNSPAEASAKDADRKLAGILVDQCTAILSGESFTVIRGTKLTEASSQSKCM